MAYVKYPGFTEGTYRFPSSGSPLMGSDTCKNLAPRRLGPTSKNSFAFEMVPGKQVVATFPKNDGRGIWSGLTTLLYAVSGDSLYSYDIISGTVTDRGTVGNDSSPVMFAHNGSTQLGINSNRRLFVDSGAGPVEVITPASPGATPPGGGVAGFVSCGGYGICFEIDTNNIFVSAVNDFTSWDPLDKQIWFATQDRLQQLSVDINNRLWLWGYKSFEPWSQLTNPGTAFPFGRGYGGNGSNSGLAARFGVGMVPGKDGTDQQCFLSSNDRGTVSVYVLQGYQAVRISNDAIESIIASFALNNDAVINGYWSPGHRFCMISFPDAEAMLVYDFATGMWHERYSGAWGSYAEPHGRFHTRPIAGPSHYWMAGDSGKLYKDVVTLYTDDGQPIYWERTAPNINNDLQEVTLGTIALDMNVGEGASTNGVSMELSRNNGETFGTAHTQSTGLNAAYRKRVQWNRNGTSSSFVPRFRGNDPRKTVIVSASIDADGDLGY